MPASARNRLRDECGGIVGGVPSPRSFEYSQHMTRRVRAPCPQYPVGFQVAALEWSDNVVRAARKDHAFAFGSSAATFVRIVLRFAGTNDRN